MLRTMIVLSFIFVSTSMFSVALSIPTAYADSVKSSDNKVVAKKKKPKTSADVFLLRGFGNVFSRGLDQISVKLKKKGVKASVVHHGEWQSVLAKIILNRKKYGRRPIVLIGHSLGANAILRIADKLKSKKITVQYMVTFAATNPMPVSSNVRKLTNYYFETDGWGKKVRKGRGFRGNLKNIDFSKSKTVGHFNIEKQPKLQRQVINNVIRFVKSKRRADAEPADKKSAEAKAS